MAKKRSVDHQLINEGKIFAVLSYLSIFCIIPLVLKKVSPFVSAHGKQGLVNYVGEIGGFIALIILGQEILKGGSLFWEYEHLSVASNV